MNDLNNSLIGSFFYNKRRFFYISVSIFLLVFILIQGSYLIIKLSDTYQEKIDYIDISKSHLHNFEQFILDKNLELDLSITLANYFFVDTKTNKIDKVTSIKSQFYTNKDIEEAIKIANKKGEYFKYKYTPNNDIELLYFRKIDDSTIIGYNKNHPFVTDSFTFNEFLKWAYANLKSFFMFNAFLFLFLFACFYRIFLYMRFKIIENMLKLRRANNILKQQSNIISQGIFWDSITDLPSRFSLENDLKIIEYPKIIILEIDDFDNTTDYYGNEIASGVLKKITDILVKYCKTRGLLPYKYSHDRFVILENSEDEYIDVQTYEEIAIDLVNQFKNFSVSIKNRYGDDEEIDIFCTIGFCVETKDCLKKALLALEKAKYDKKDYLCYYKNLNLTKQYLERIEYANLIKKAIIDNQVIPYFQPIFDRNKKIVKYESLARIVSEEQGVILPGIFLENSKHIHKYSQIIKKLFSICFKHLTENKNLHLSLNISYSEMIDGDVSVFIIEELIRLRIAKQITFEILEKESLKEPERIIEFIHKIRNLGAKIAIDDFGTGYSNFAYILQIKPDYIKIDGSIVKFIDVDENSLIMLKAIVAFCKKLNIKTVAEFIYSKAVFDICLEAGIDEFQGFYLAQSSDKFLEN